MDMSNGNDNSYFSLCFMTLFSHNLRYFGFTWCQHVLLLLIVVRRPSKRDHQTGSTYASCVEKDQGSPAKQLEGEEQKQQLAVPSVLFLLSYSMLINIVPPYSSHKSMCIDTYWLLILPSTMTMSWLLWTWISCFEKQTWGLFCFIVSKR
jgi:hypothetical protein